MKAGCFAVSPSAWRSISDADLQDAVEQLILRDEPAWTLGEVAYLGIEVEGREADLDCHGGLPLHLGAICARIEPHLNHSKGRLSQSTDTGPDGMCYLSMIARPDFPPLPVRPGARVAPNAAGADGSFLSPAASAKQGDDEAETPRTRARGAGEEG